MIFYLFFFLLKLLGAVELFVRAYHLKRLGQEVKKKKNVLCEFPEKIENTEILVKQQYCIIRLNRVGNKFKAPCHTSVCACMCPSVCVRVMGSMCV